MDQVTSVVLRKLTKKDSFSFSLNDFEHDSLWHHYLSEMDFRHTNGLISGAVKFWSWYLVNY